jgi:hypothetical protein
MHFSKFGVTTDYRTSQRFNDLFAWCIFGSKSLGPWRINSRFIV